MSSDGNMSMAMTMLLAPQVLILEGDQALCDITIIVCTDIIFEGARKIPPSENLRLMYIWFFQVLCITKWSRKSSFRAMSPGLRFLYSTTRATRLGLLTTETSECLNIKFASNLGLGRLWDVFSAVRQNQNQKQAVKIWGWPFSVLSFV